MRKRIAVIDEQLNRVVRIIQDLLSSTRQRKPDPSWMSVEQVIAPATALMEPAFHAKGVALTSELAIGIPLVWADAEAASSAGDASRTRQPRRTTEKGCACEPAPRPKNWTRGSALQDMSSMVTVAVRDTGIGMPPSDVQRLRRFSRRRRLAREPAWAYS
jgi:signal transduction histidine kinase